MGNPANPFSQEEIMSRLAELRADLEFQREHPKAYKKWLIANHPGALPYDEYLRTAHWRKIRKRVLERDGKSCRRCGGKATRVHHRSYVDDVLRGNDDDQLASICEGCHEIIHFDELGKRRNPDETDRLLLTRDESREYPPPKVDVRRTKRIQYPREWPRMTDIQRSAWFHEYQRLKIIRWGQLGKNKKVVSMMLRSMGMDDASINLAISVAKRKRGSRSFE